MSARSSGKKSKSLLISELWEKRTIVLGATWELFDAYLCNIYFQVRC
jgi:hypothetical protein